MYDPAHRRHSIRLRGHDYTQPGAYYVTVCTYDRRCLFGEILDGQMRRNKLGDIVHDEWYRTASVRREIRLDAFVVMPNHIHGTIEITELKTRAGSMQLTRRGDAARRPYPAGPEAGSLGAIIGQIKSATTRQINRMEGEVPARAWQRNFYDRVVRNKQEMQRVREHILANPQTWARDHENPANPFCRTDDIEVFLGPEDA
jgi:putative transposase